MPSRRRIAALALALSLALPAGALAQGAGDDQYQDPFAGENDTSGGGGGGGGGAEGTSGSELSSTPPSEQQASNSNTPAGELPRTGADPSLIALLGAGFVLTGAGIRARVRRPFV